MNILSVSPLIPDPDPSLLPSHPNFLTPRSRVTTASSPSPEGGNENRGGNRWIAARLFAVLASPCCASLRNYAPFYSPLFPNCREGREREALETDPSSPHGCQMAIFYPYLSLDCARVEGVGAQSKEMKGSHFAVQRSGAIVQKSKGPNTYNLKIWL